jgi:hypothetical protein
MRGLEDLILRRNAALRVAHSILEEHEAAESRVLTLRGSFESLTGLPVDVAEYYRESLSALQVGCYRAGIVMAWAGFIHMVAEAMVGQHQASLIANYPKWKTGTLSDLFASAPRLRSWKPGRRLASLAARN